jgi:RecB family exonuclease
MQFSYSRVSTALNCPHQYKLRYIDKLKTLPEQDANNALYLGTAIHEAFETGNVEDAIKSYRSNYYMLSNEHINEEIKLLYQIPRVLELLPDAECEVEIKTDDFIGYIDRLVPLGTDENGISHYEIWDYKYSNNVDRYLESAQLHLYKYYFELTHPNTVVDALKYVFVPKVNIRQKKSETIYDFRQRLKEYLETTSIRIEEVKYDENIISQFKQCCQALEKVKEYPKNPTKLCDWCGYKEYCQSNGQIDYMIL